MIYGKIGFSLRFAHFKKRAPWALKFLKRANRSFETFARAGIN